MSSTRKEDQLSFGTAWWLVIQFQKRRVVATNRLGAFKRIGSLRKHRRQEMNDVNDVDNLQVFVVRISAKITPAFKAVLRG